MVRWNGHSWGPVPNPLNFLRHFATDDDGVMAGFSWRAGEPGAKLMRSKDNGITWEGENVGQIGNGTTIAFDHRYLYETKRIRFQIVQLPAGQKTGTVKVFTAQF